MKDGDTTVRVTDEQKERINEMSGTQPEVIGRILSAYTEEQQLTENRVRELAREEIRESVVREAQT